MIYICIHMATVGVKGLIYSRYYQVTMLPKQGQTDQTSSKT